MPAYGLKPVCTGRAEEIQVIGAAVQVFDVQAHTHTARCVVADHHRDALVVGAHREHAAPPASGGDGGGTPGLTLHGHEPHHALSVHVVRAVVAGAHGYGHHCCCSVAAGHRGRTAWGSRRDDLAVDGDDAHCVGVAREWGSEDCKRPIEGNGAGGCGGRGGCARRWRRGGRRRFGRIRPGGDVDGGSSLAAAGGNQDGDRQQEHGLLHEGNHGCERQFCARGYVSGTILHLKQGPTLTPRAPLEGVRNDGRHLLSVLFYVDGGIVRTLNLAEVTSHRV